MSPSLPLTLLQGGSLESLGIQLFHKLDSNSNSFEINDANFRDLAYLSDKYIIDALAKDVRYLLLNLFKCDIRTSLKNLSLGKIKSHSIFGNLPLATALSNWSRTAALRKSYLILSKISLLNKDF